MANVEQTLPIRRTLNKSQNLQFNTLHSALQAGILPASTVLALVLTATLANVLQSTRNAWQWFKTTQVAVAFMAGWQNQASIPRNNKS
jgi:hypothetical protein